MITPLTAANQQSQKRLNSDYYVEGFATTFDTPYLMYEVDGVKYYEVIDRHALDEADLSDVIFQYNHADMVYARNKMAKNKPPSLLLEAQESGFFVAADLGLTTDAKRIFEGIDSGLIHKMSWAFVVAPGGDSYDAATHTRRIFKIKKVYDVSAVSFPANDDTDITARSFFDGVIEKEKRETLARKAKILALKLNLEV